MINIILFRGPHDPAPHVIDESYEWLMYFLVYRLSRTVIGNMVLKLPHPYPHYKSIIAGVGLFGEIGRETQSLSC